MNQSTFYMYVGAAPLNSRRVKVVQEVRDGETDSYGLSERICRMFSYTSIYSSTQDLVVQEYPKGQIFIMLLDTVQGTKYHLYSLLCVECHPYSFIASLYRSISRIPAP